MMTNGTDIQIGSRIDIPRNNKNLPEATTYEKFRELLKNTKNDVTTKSIQYTTDFIIRPQTGNSETTRNTNTYAIQTTNNNGQEVLVCYVVGQDQMEQFTSDYTTQEISNHKVNVRLQIIEGIESTSAITSSQNELGELKDRVTGFAFTETAIKEFFKNQKNEVDHVTKQYKHRADEVKDQSKRRLNSSVLEKEMFTLLDFSIEEGLDNVQRLEISLKNLEDEYKKGLLDEPTRKDKTERIATELRNHTLQQSHIGQIINSLVVSSDQVLPDLDIKLPINGSQDAEKVRKVYSKMVMERLLINNISLETDLRKVQGQHEDDLYEYLKISLDTGITQEPFLPAVGYEKAFNSIKETNPQIAKYLDSFMPTGTTAKNKTKEPTDGSTSGSTDGKKEQLQTNPEHIIKPGKGGFLDKITLGFISDGIDKSNMSATEKQGAKKVAGIISLIGLGALAIRGWRKAFNKDSKFEGKDRFIGGLAATLFAGSMITSKNNNPLDFKSLGEKIGSRFSSSPDNIPGNNKESTPEQTTLGGIVSMNTIFGGMSGGQIKSMLKENNGKMSINYDAAKTTIEANKGNISNATERLKIIESLKNSPNQQLIPVALDALGITSESLTQNTGKKYEDFAEKGINNFMSLYEYMETNGYKKWNQEMTRDIYKYMRGEDGYNLATLAKMGAFEKDEVLPTTSDPLKNNIQTLTIIKTDEEKQLLYLQAHKIFNELKNLQYQGEMKFIESNGVLYLETYNKKTAIDLTSKKIGNISLYTTYQTLKAANLTNRMQDIFKGKSDNDKPFNISLAGTDIEFEQNSLTSTDGWKNIRQFTKDKFDTEAIAAGRGGTLKDIAPSLEENKQAYVDYLNSLPGRKK